MDNMIVNKEYKRRGLIQTQGILNIAKYRIVNSCGLGHIAICNVAGEKAPAYAYEMNLEKEALDKFCETLVPMFYKLTDAIFLRSAAC